MIDLQYIVISSQQIDQYDYKIWQENKQENNIDYGQQKKESDFVNKVIDKDDTLGFSVSAACKCTIFTNLIRSS